MSWSHIISTGMTTSASLRNSKYKLIEDTVKKLSKNGLFMGPEKLYRILKAKGVEKIGKYTIRRWLQKQDWYSLNKPSRRTFKRVKVRVSEMNGQFDADLADMVSLSRYNKGFKYLLIVIDILTRFLWVQPLKNKTGKEVTRAFAHIFKGGRICKRLRTDKGGEFTNLHTQQYLKSKGIYYFTTQNSETKANYAERAIKTFKNMLYRYMSKYKTKHYLNVLQDLVNQYNETPHSSLGNIAPRDVNVKNQADVWAYQYLNPLVYKKEHTTPYRFKVGDWVRISNNNSVFKRSFNEQFTREIFKIYERFKMQGIPVYKIKDFSDEKIKETFTQPSFRKLRKMMTHYGPSKEKSENEHVMEN